MTHPAPSQPRPASRIRAFRRWKEAGLAYLFLLPSALILGSFGFAPLIQALLLSLQRYRQRPEGWVGLANYQDALQASEFWQSLGVTLYFVLGTVPPTLVLGYLLAELLHSRIRGLGFYRTLFFLPYIASPVAAAAVWRWILNPDYGVATALAGRFGTPPRWLDESTGVLRLIGLPLPEALAGPSLALLCVIVVTIWHSLGFAVVVLLAGLAAIPADVTDAARLDGARGWALIRSVKLPLLSPTLFFLLVVFTIRAFQTFTQIYVLTAPNPGEPGGTTRNITLYIYESFYVRATSLGEGYGAAVAMLLFVIILGLTLIQFRVVGRRVHYG